MSNPLRSLKYLPWSILFQSAAVTVAIATLIDYGLFWGLDQWVASQPNPSLLIAIVGSIFFVSLAAAYAIGALALFITKRFFREVVITAESLWALIGCVIALYWLRTWLPVSGLLMEVNIYSLVMITLGAFFTGKRYWR